MEGAGFKADVVLIAAKPAQAMLIYEAALKAAGVAAIFPPGTVVAEAAEGVLRSLNQRLGHPQAAE